MPVLEEVVLGVRGAARVARRAGGGIRIFRLRTQGQRVAVAHDRDRGQPVEHELAERIVVAVVRVHLVHAAHAAVGADAAVVVVVVRQAQPMAGLVDDRRRLEAARGVVVALPLPREAVERHAVQVDAQRVQVPLVAPPERRPGAVRAGPDHAQVVDRAVAVVVVPAVVDVRVEMVRDLLDDAAVREVPVAVGVRVPRALVGHAVPAEHVALEP